MLRGEIVTLRPMTEKDVPAVAAIRATPEVVAIWGEPDEETDETVRHLVVLFEDRIVGMIQWSVETDPQYSHAGIDIFLDPAVHSRGLGTDAVRTLTRHLIHEQGFHRIVIDPAASNTAAIRCYTKAGFRPVGIMRQYELGTDGTWHDGLLMDLLASDLTAP
jgi:aminoglycoside 6'-N-acetyltransferase